jgi:hypothetical protein
MKARLSLLAILSIGAVYIFFRDASQGTLPFEVAKSLLQVGVVAVAGAVISVLTFDYQRKRLDAERQADITRLSTEKERDIERAANEKERDLGRQAAEKERELQRQAVENERDRERQSVEYREGLLMATLTSTMNAYARTKKARRLLRARARVPMAGGALIRAEQYDLYLDWINDAQLDFENLARDIDTSAQAFTKPAFLKDELHKMDSYLETLIEEYEKERGKFTGEPLARPLIELPALADFLLRTSESKFNASVVFPYRNVQQGLRQDLLHPGLLSAAMTPGLSIGRTT